MKRWPMVHGARHDLDLDGQIVPALMDALGMTEEDVLPLIAAAEALPA